MALPLTESQFAETWPLGRHLNTVIAAREAATDKESYTAVATLLRQEGDLVQQRAEAYRAYLAEHERNAGPEDLTDATVSRLRRLPPAIREAIRAKMGW